MADNIQQSKELALRQLESIKALRESSHFHNYFLYRLKEKHGTLVDRLIHDPATKKVTRLVDGKPVEVEIPFCTKEQREEIRQVILELEDILGMMSRDEHSAAAYLRQGDGAGQAPNAIS